MYENIKIISKSEMDGIEIGMDNPDGTKCPLGNLTWYGKDDCNAIEDEAFAVKICHTYNKYDKLVEALTKLYSFYKEKCIGKKHTVKQISQMHRQVKQALKEADELK